MKIETPFSGGLVALMVVIVLGAVVTHFVDAPGDVRISAIKLEPATKASKASRPRQATGAPLIIDGGVVTDPSQFVPPAMSPLMKTVVVPKGASCVKLFGLSLDKCIEQAEKSGRPVLWHRDATGKVTVDVPMVAGEIVYMLKNTETEEVLPHFLPVGPQPVDISVEPNKKPSR